MSVAMCLGSLECLGVRLPGMRATLFAFPAATFARDSPPPKPPRMRSMNFTWLHPLAILPFAIREVRALC